GTIFILLFAMTPLLRRGTQSMIKVVADQVGLQANSEQLFNANTGTLEESYIAARSDVDQSRIEQPGTVTYVYGDRTGSVSNAFLNLGFTESQPR
ncbi:MAG TPA: hypothetical protein VI522_02835, partial [Gammaproteobacteria bacterium]|nr:hypothetical protein [Gammaproteobacteria bacterium]